MNIIDEINKFSAEKDKPALLYLFNKYHMDWQWRFVAYCTHQRYGVLSYQTNRVWKPSTEGTILYLASQITNKEIMIG